MNIVVLDGYTLNPGDLSWHEFESLGSLTIYDRTAPDQVIPRASGADAILTNKTILDADTIHALPRLSYIGVLATGYNVVDIAAATAAGITITNIPAYSTASVAQMVFAHLLAITQRVEHYTAENRRGRWTTSPDFSYADTPLTELAGKQFGIVGLGHIGMAVAHIALSFGMTVKAVTSKHDDGLPQGISKTDLDTLFATSDVVSLHCPLNADTHHLVNARRLRLMKPTAILINTGRGPLVDETALAEALAGGTIRAAGVDVLSTEPPLPDNPLLSAPNCFITPHIAWATKEARARLMEIAATNLRNFIHGTPVNIVIK